MSAGRPTIFSEETIVKTREYIRDAVPENMSIPTMEGLALHLGVNGDTLVEWAKENEEFSAAIVDLKMWQKQHLMITGLFGGKEINANVAIFLMRVNHEMIELTRTDITSKGQKLEAPHIILDTKQE